jgi:hypothetical protein
LDLSHELNIIGVGGTDGRVEFYDFDQKNKASELVPKIDGDEISCLKF